MILYSRMCNVCNVCNASHCSLLRFAVVNFLRKVSIFSGKVAKKNRKIKKFIWSIRNCYTRICRYQKLFVSLQSKKFHIVWKTFPKSSICVGCRAAIYLTIITVFPSIRLVGVYPILFFCCLSHLLFAAAKVKMSLRNPHPSRRNLLSIQQQELTRSCLY